MFVNLPPKVDDNMKKTKKMSLEQIMMAIDDLKGSIFVYAGFLKPGKQ